MKISENPVHPGSGAASGTDKAMPKDGRVMMAILKDMNITEYEPRVIEQLLEFSYRYVSSILEDSRVLSQHARKKAVDIDDVKLAVQMYTEHNLTSPPTRDVLLEVSARKNGTPLPIPKVSGGLRLPPDRYCLTAVNYKLKPLKKRGGYAGKGNNSKGNANYSSATGFTMKTMPSSGFASQSVRLNTTFPSSASSAPKIQIQTQERNAPPMFSMTVNPSVFGGAAANVAPTMTGVKRTADQMNQN